MSLSEHLIERFEDPSATGPTTEAGTGVLNMSFDSSIHGVVGQSIPAPPPFSAQAFHPRLGIETAQRIAQLKAKLDRQLGPEYVSQRPGPGGGPKLTYIEGWKVINVANEVFGFDGWASSITSLTVDFVSLLISMSYRKRIVFVHMVYLHHEDACALRSIWLEKDDTALESQP